MPADPCLVALAVFWLSRAGAIVCLEDHSFVRQITMHERQAIEAQTIMQPRLCLPTETRQPWNTQMIVRICVGQIVCRVSKESGSLCLQGPYCIWVAEDI